MRTWTTGLLAVALALTASRAPARQAGNDAAALVARMMKFDKNADGKLSKDEITDARLLGLFGRADADKDGVVTKEELAALFAKELATDGGGKGWFFWKGDPPVKDKPKEKKPAEVPFSVEASRKAVEKAMPMLWKGIEGHSEHRACYTCHNHGVPLIALAAARERGFDVPAKKMAEQTEFVSDFLIRHKERFLKGMGPGPLPEGGETDNTGYALLTLEMLGKAPDEGTAAAVEFTLLRDKRRGYWFTPSPRPPSEASSFMTTALALRGIRKYGTAEQKDRVAQRVEAARAWLLKTRPKDTEDRVFRLIGLKSAGAADDEVKQAARDLLESQRDDGGWGQLDSMPSDAYATGSALFALHLAGGVAADDPAYRRGLNFLIATQREDGSWHVKTRSRPFQKYFETGFPYGKDQFISCHATGWAAAALAFASPARAAGR